MLDYGEQTPSRGDVVVFRSPYGDERDFAKRIIGLPGEAIEIDESRGTISTNGEVLSEPYAQGVTSCGKVTCSWTIPEAGSSQAREQCDSERCYFVLGDNRPNSSDSRQGWLVPAEDIVGYVELD